MNAPAIGVLIVASLLAANGLLILGSSQVEMNGLNNQFNNVMNGTMSFLNRAWNVSQQFQNPNYNYDPSDLGNFTIPETPSANTTG